MKREEPLFVPRPIDDSMKAETSAVDLNALYERACSELALQQTKRDQIITLYLAIFSFLVPFALSLEGLQPFVKGLLFLAAAVVGIIFGMIIIRYRVYKEVYWLSCQSISVLFGIKIEMTDKSTVQSVFYECLKKKGKGYITVAPDGTKKFSRGKYIRKNLFSSECLYFLVHLFITAAIFAMGIGLILPGNVWVRSVVAVVLALCLICMLMQAYFVQCIGLYLVLEDEKESSFNRAFSKAWFLHLYL